MQACNQLCNQCKYNKLCNQSKNMLRLEHKDKPSNVHKTQHFQWLFLRVEIQMSMFMQVVD